MARAQQVSFPIQSPSRPHRMSGHGIETSTFPLLRERPPSAEGMPLPGGVLRRELRIVHIAAPASVGGLERVVHALATGHHRRGHRVRVAAVITGGGEHHPFVRPLREEGVEVEVIEIPSRAYLRERAAIARICASLRPDIVHTHGYRCDVVGASAARRWGIPTITTVHGFTGGSWRNRLYERIQRRAFRRFDAVVAVSRPLSERLAASGVDSRRLRLLQNAWPGDLTPLERQVARERLGVDADAFLVGWVGRLTAEKGPDVFVNALRRLPDVPWQALVIGEGRERARLSREAAATGLSSRLRWTGTLPEAGLLLRAFDVFVLSSRTEGTPIVLFEAMAAGVPIVATRVGGVPDVTSPAEALLVPSESPDALAEAIRRVWRCPEAAADRARAAQAGLEKFALDPWLDRYDALYRSLVRSPTPSQQ